MNTLDRFSIKDNVVVITGVPDHLEEITMKQ